MILRNFTLTKKRKIILVIVGIFILAGLGIFIRQKFFAEEEGAYSLNGTIYDKETKTALAGVKVEISADRFSENTNTISTTSNSAGYYTLNLPSRKYNYISISKESYGTLAGIVNNLTSSSTLSANVTLSKDAGDQDIQLVFTKASPENRLGLSLVPADDAVSSFTQINANGSSYSEESVNALFKAYDLAQNNWVTHQSLPNYTEETASMPAPLIQASSIYYPPLDRYYLIGGIKSDGSSSKSIYEFERSEPQASYEVATLPPTAQIHDAALYLHNKLIYIFSPAQIYVFDPKEKKVFPLATSELIAQPAANRQPLTLPLSKRIQIIKTSNKLLFATEDNLKTSFYNIDQASLDKITTAACYDVPTNPPKCSLDFTNQQFSIARIGTTLYTPPNSDSTNEKVFVLGGLENNLSSSYMGYLNPNNLQGGLKAYSSKLLYPQSFASVYTASSGYYLYLTGGLTDNNTPTTKIQRLDLPKTTGEPARSSSDSLILKQPISKTQIAEDSQGRAFIFDGVKIQRLSPRPLLKRGHVLTIGNTTKNYTFIIGGKSKEDPFSFTMKSANSPVAFGDPILKDIPMSDISVKDGAKAYNLKDAMSSGLIRSGMGFSQGGTTQNLMIDNLDLYSKTLASGTSLALTSIKPNINVTFGREVSGVVYDSATHAPLTDVDITLISDDPAFAGAPISTRSGSGGSYNASSLSASYDTVMVAKEGFKTAVATMVSNSLPGSLPQAAVPMESGNGTQYLEGVPVKKGEEKIFGLSYVPVNNAAVKLFSKDGDSYKETPLTGSVSGFELADQQFVPLAQDKFRSSNLDRFDEELIGASVATDPATNKSYIFGGLSKQTNKPVKTVYSYDYRNEGTELLNDTLPKEIYHAGTIALPDENLILIIGGKDSNGASDKIYSYGITQNKTRPVSSITAKERYQSLIIGEYLYFFGDNQSDVSVSRINLTTVKNNLKASNCFPYAENDCNLPLPIQNVFTTNKIMPGFSLAYSTPTNRIYFFGGNAGSSYSNKISSISIPSLNASLEAEIITEPAILPYAVSYASVLKDSYSSKIYLMGGKTSATAKTDKITLINPVGVGTLQASEISSKLPFQIGDVASAEDPNSCLILFSSTGALSESTLAEPPDPSTIHSNIKMTPTATLKVGQVYKLTAPEDGILYIVSQDQESDSYETHRLETDDFLINKPGTRYYLSSFNGVENLYDYKITYQGEEFNLVKAAQNNLIEPIVKINERAIDLSITSSVQLKNYYVGLGDIFSFVDKADMEFSRDNSDLEPSYENGYLLIPKLIEAFQAENVPDYEILNILGQLDNCDPSYFDRRSNDEDRDRCLNSIQLEDDPVITPTPTPIAAPQ